MNVVVTGAAGEIGTAIRPHLRRMFAEVRLVDRVPIHDTTSSETYVLGDVADANLLNSVLRGAHAVIHLAGIKSEVAWPELFEANVQLVQRLLTAAETHGICRIALASTMHVMGFYRRDERVLPDASPRPDSRYATSKLLAEIEGQRHALRTRARVSSVRIGCFKERLEDAEPCAWIGAEDLARLFHHVLLHPKGDAAVVHAVAPYRNDDCGQRRLRWRHGFRFEHHGISRRESLRRAAVWYPSDPVARLYRGGEFASATLRHATEDA